MVINEFQTILIGAGASVVAVVWIYNLVQERKHRKAAEAIFQGTQRPAPSETSAAMKTSQIATSIGRAAFGRTK